MNKLLKIGRLEKNKDDDLKKNEIAIKERSNFNERSSDLIKRYSSINLNHSRNLNNLSRSNLEIDKKGTGKNSFENQDDFTDSTFRKGIYVKTIVKTPKKVSPYKITGEYKRNNKFSFTHKEIIQLNFLKWCLSTKKLKKKYKLFKIAEEKLEDKLELSYVMSKLEEVEKLKVVLLNNQQLAVFNNLPNEICTLSKENLKQFKFNNLIEFQKSREKLDLELKNFLNRMRNYEEFTDSLDQRLYDLLPPEMIKYLENNEKIQV